MQLGRRVGGIEHEVTPFAVPEAGEGTLLRVRAGSGRREAEPGERVAKKRNESGGPGDSGLDHEHGSGVFGIARKVPRVSLGKGLEGLIPVKRNLVKHIGARDKGDASLKGHAALALNADDLLRLSAGLGDQ
jgi:hypothetical protein